jgi:ABC-type transporter Mla maintaining outer membrane lipid asymmetry ATPase subunit MlaF
VNRQTLAHRPLVEARGVGLIYPGRTVLQGVDLSVKPGELVIGALGFLLDYAARLAYRRFGAGRLDGEQ